MKSIDHIDHFGYLVPGTLMLALLLWLSRGFAGMTISLFDTGFGAAIAAILAGYVLGYLVQLLSEGVLGPRIHGMQERYSAEYCEEQGNRFSSDLRERFQNKVRDVFGFVPVGSELLELCYTHLVSRNMERLAERHLHKMTLVRGLLMVVWIGLPISLLIFVKHFVLLILRNGGVFIPVTVFLDYDEVQLAMGIVFSFACLLLVGGFRKALRRSVEGVVAAIYESFAILDGTQAKLKNS